MTIAHLLEQFGSDGLGTMEQALPDVSLEEHQLEAFEQGYQAGWDDSAKAHAEEQSCVSYELSQAMQEISFGYREAYCEVMKDLAPVLRDMLSKILPVIAKNALAARVAEQLVELLQDGSDGVVLIRVSPSDYEAMNAVLSKNTSLPLKIEIDPERAVGQVQLATPLSEFRLETAPVIAGITSALDAYLSEVFKEKPHG